MKQEGKKFFPAEQKKIRDRIKRYERAFGDPHHDDGAGKRFLLGPLYIILEDAEGAMRHYVWYKNAFPDDIAEPMNHLCWTLTLLRSGDSSGDHVKFIETVFSNLYLIPVLNGERPNPYGFQHQSNWEDLSYIIDGPIHEIFPCISSEERSWLLASWQENDIQERILRFIDIQNKLTHLKPGAERSRLVREKFLIAQPVPDQASDTKNLIYLSKHRN